MRAISPLLSVLLSCTLSGQVTPALVETQVNTNTTGAQQAPAVAANTLGNYVIVWESFGQDGDGYGVYGQLYAADGTPSGGELALTTTTAADQRFPSVAMTDDGGFIVVWQSFGQDGAGWGVYLRTFAADGTATSAETLVNTVTAGQQRHPVVATDGLGDDTVVVWEQNGDIYRRYFDAAGTALGPALLANTTTTGTQAYPTVASNDAGAVIVAWQSLDQAGNGYDVRAQRFDNTGGETGDEFRVNTTTAGHQLEPAVAIDGRERLAIAWQSYGQDGDGEGVYLRTFAADDAQTSPEVMVNTVTAGAQTRPALALTDNDALLVAWNSYEQDGAFYGVYAQAYDFQGGEAPLLNGPEFRVNTSMTNFQQEPALAATDSEGVVVTWQDGTRTGAGADGDGYGVFQAQYTVARLLPTDLLSFSGRLAGKHNQLDWMAANAVDFSYFGVQRSTDGTSWSDLGEVAPQYSGSGSAAGAGVRSNEQSYGFTDVDPLPESYYRLRLVDLDGSYTFSPIVLLRRVVSSASLAVYPNPSDGRFRVEFPPLEGPATLVLYTAHGTRVRAQKMKRGATSWIHRMELPAGQYFLMIDDGGERTGRVVVQ